MKPRSLTASLGWGLSLGLTALALLQWLLVTLVLQQLIFAYVGSRLEHDADSLIHALSLSPDGLPLLQPETQNPIFSRPFSGHYYRLSVGGIVLSSRSLWQGELPLATLAPGEERLLRQPGPRGQQLLIRQTRVDKDGRQVLLATAEDIGPLNGKLADFGWIYLLITLAVLLLLLAAQAWLIRRQLAPLLHTRQELLQLAAEKIQRLDEDVPAELLPLVKSFNQLLGLQSQRLQRARNSLADLSHALKRPLSRIRQLLETRPWPELEAELSTLSSQIERQLSRARLAGSSPLLATLSLQTLLQELLRALEKLYADKSLRFRLEGPDLALKMERQDALELLGNLLDNACKWARSEVVIRSQGSSLLIGDDGPGVAAEWLEQLSQRGVRADQQTPGHGLGLAIARELIQSYGGELRLGTSAELGGLEVELNLAAVISAGPDQSRP